MSEYGLAVGSSFGERLERTPGQPEVMAVHDTSLYDLLMMDNRSATCTNLADRSIEPIPQIL